MTQNSVPRPMASAAMKAVRYEWRKRRKPSPSIEPKIAAATSAMTATPAAAPNKVLPAEAIRMLSEKPSIGTCSAPSGAAGAGLRGTEAAPSPPLTVELLVLLVPFLAVAMSSPVPSD